MYTTEALLDEGAPKVRFGRRERRGAFLGFSWLQIILVSSTAAAFLFTLVLFTDQLPFLLPLYAVVGALGGVSYRRESLLTIIGHRLGYFTRKLAGQDSYLRDVWERHDERVIEAARIKAERGSPVKASTFVMPGSLGAIETFQSAHGGAFTLDRKNNVVGLTLRVSSEAWPLRDKSAQLAAYDGMVDWMSSLATIPGVSEVTARIRVDTAASTELQDYVNERDAERGNRFAITPELEKEYAELIALGSKRSMSFSNFVTVGFHLDKMRGDIKQSGGGLPGLGAVLERVAEALEDSLNHTRAKVDSWLPAPEMQSVLSATSDPASAAVRRERESGGRRAAMQNPPIMSVQEHPNRLSIDGSEHATYWITEWPRSEVRTGFLEPLLYAGSATRVLTLQMRPVPIHKALTRITRAQNDIATAQAVQLKFNVKPTREELREAEELDEREEQLADGFADIDYRGFVTVSAPSVKELDKGRMEIETASEQARIVLGLLWRQQAAAFMTAALPLAIGGKR